VGRYRIGAAVILAGGIALAAWQSGRWARVRRMPAAAVPGSAATSGASRAEPVRLVAVGDLMLGGAVRSLIRARGPDYPFRPFRRLLQEADIAFGNLETPLSERGIPTPGKSRRSLRARTNFLFRAPPTVANGVGWAGFDVVSVANNHTMDYGGDALEDTLTSLSQAGVIPVGAGQDLDAAAAPIFLERRGQRFAVFALSDILPVGSAAGPKRPGVAPARGQAFESRMPAAIAQARRQADWVLVSVHWGRERFRGATARQRSLGHRLVDWGADVVIGHHTHCRGPSERYHGGLIHYSLGNFIADRWARVPPQAWEVLFRPQVRPTATCLTLRLDRNLRVDKRIETAYNLSRLQGGDD
jgi:poly-gamma-glutamate capsule biosynthesis protein CapA/YwtB (metallophosphatase superfamily)